MTTTLEAALRYADRGWHVFPVAPPPNKRPVTENGFHDATTSHAQITAWWTAMPSAQIGVSCGASKLCALDLDEKHDQGISGRFSIEEAGYDLVMAELVMRTPRGGWQAFFAMPDEVVRRQLSVLPGVDILGDGGYTIVPSPASPGREWERGDFTEPLESMPEELLQLCERRGDVRIPSVGIDSSRVIPLEEATVIDIERALGYVENDTRKSWLRIGMALKSTGAGQQAYDIWTRWSQRHPTGLHPKFDEKDQLKTWRTIREMKLDGREVTIDTLFWMAKEAGYQGPSPDDPDIEFDFSRLRSAIADAGVCLCEFDAEHRCTKCGRVETATEHLRRQDDLRLRRRTLDLDSPFEVTKRQLTFLEDDEVALLPPIEWQVDGLIPKESIVVLAGDTEAGKSFWAINTAMRLVYGMPVHGREVVPGNVIYMPGEGQQGLAARLRAWRSHWAHAGRRDDRWMVVTSEIPPLTKRTIEQLHKMVAHIAAQKGAPPDLIVIDTLSQALDDDENEAKVVAPIIRGLMALRRRWGCTILIVHHLVKLQQKGKVAAPEPTKDSVRGAGALTRNVDTVLGLVTGNETAGERVFHVWKQKDGQKPAPDRLWLEPVETGWTRADGRPEWSCILTPDVVPAGLKGLPSILDKGRETAPQTPEEEAAARIEAMVDRIAATLTAAGCVGPDAKGMGRAPSRSAPAARRTACTRSPSRRACAPAGCTTWARTPAPGSSSWNRST